MVSCCNSEIQRELRKYFTLIQTLHYCQLTFSCIVWCCKYANLQHLPLLHGTNSNVSKTRKPWSKGKEATILKAFNGHFQSTNIPAKMECLQAQKQYQIFRTHPWEKSQRKVWNFKLEIQQQSVKRQSSETDFDKSNNIYRRYGQLHGLFNQ